MLKRIKNKIHLYADRNTWWTNRNFIIRSLKYLKGDVIDIGCDTGKYKGIILSAPDVKSYTGLDFYRTSVCDIVADLNKPLPIEDEKYDSAICISVIEHLKEPQLALNEMARILKKGGYLILATPWIFPYHEEPEDYFRYSRQALEHMFEKAGFEVVYYISGGGRMRIITTIFARWSKIYNKFNFLIEYFLSLFDTLEKNEKNPSLNTISHHFIVRKI